MSLSGQVVEHIEQLRATRGTVLKATCALHVIWIRVREVFVRGFTCTIADKASTHRRVSQEGMKDSGKSGQTDFSGENSDFTCGQLFNAHLVHHPVHVIHDTLCKAPL